MIKVLDRIIKRLGRRKRIRFYVIVSIPKTFKNNFCDDFVFKKGEKWFYVVDMNNYLQEQELDKYFQEYTQSLVGDIQRKKRILGIKSQIFVKGEIIIVEEESKHTYGGYGREYCEGRKPSKWGIINKIARPRDSEHYIIYEVFRNIKKAIKRAKEIREWKNC
ncbi:MAG: hypothetical protein AB1567_04575 [bacterium]